MKTIASHSEDVQTSSAFIPNIILFLRAFNGEELIQNIDKHYVDLILLDIQMPGMGGIECTRLIYRKLQVNNRMHAVRKAADNGLV